MMSIEKYDPEASKRTRFISLRWRSLFPIALLVTIAAMVGAYFLASNLTEGIEVSEANLVMQSSASSAERSVELYTHQRSEAQRIAFTVGIPEAARAQQNTSLHALLEGLAAAADLDSVIITGTDGIEITGLLRTQASDFTDYAVSSGTDLSAEPLIQDILADGTQGSTGLMRTSEGLILFTGMPLKLNDELVGTVLVGQQLDAVLDELQTSALSDVTLYGTDGVMLQTTFRLEGDASSALMLDSTLLNQALDSVQQVVGPVHLTINELPYIAAYAPFVYGPNTLGVINALTADDVPFATELGRQATALVISAITGVVVMSVFFVVTAMTGRMGKVTAVAQSLATGASYARTGMQATDEIGAMGQALDQYAEVAQARQDKLRDMLRRKRREVNYLVAVLESVPDGIVVQDLDGRVILMNERARVLLGSQRVFRSAGLHELTAVVTDVLGVSLAPGIYALGDPRRIDLDGRMLSAQAAAVTTMSDARLGTVILLHDITEDVQQQQAREAMISQLAEDIQQPLSGLAQTGARSPNSLVNAFAREISRYSAGLQKMIVEMRELNGYDRQDAEQVQRPLLIEALIWAVANDWRQIAQAANITLHVIIEEKGLYVLGDEPRLRWALGNIVDNAIKYTQPGGAMTLEIKGNIDGLVHMRIRDNGVGIDRDELGQVFIRFYRGTPTTEDGRVIRVPGMGQGLTVAKQIVEAHGGKIRVKSKVQVGTAVYVALPLTAGMGYELPYLDDEMMEGETMLLPEDVNIDTFWDVPGN